MAKPQKTTEQINIVVHGKNIDLRNDFSSDARTKLQETAGRYFKGLVKAEVTISRNTGDQIRANISVHPAKRVTIQASSEAFDAATAFNKAAEKIGAQLRERKEKISRRRKPAIAAIKTSGPQINANGIKDNVVLDFVEPAHSKAVEQQRLAAMGVPDLVGVLSKRPGWSRDLGREPWDGITGDPYAAGQTPTTSPAPGAKAPVLGKQ